MRNQLPVLMISSLSSYYILINIIIWQHQSYATIAWLINHHTITKISDINRNSCHYNHYTTCNTRSNNINTILSCSSSSTPSKQREKEVIDKLSSSLLELCHLLDVSSPNGYHEYLHLSGNDAKKNSDNNEVLFQDITDKEETVERGLYIKCNVPKDEIIFQIPLSSCLADDTPPKWLIDHEENDTSDDEHYQHISNHPAHWATRLAASFLNIQEKCNVDDKLLEGFHKWISLLPSPQQLRSSLPVHWNDNVLSKARCYALEICVDSMYFTRADAVDVLLNGLKNLKGDTSRSDTTTLLMEEKDLASRCHRALDIVQTRTCRVDFACNNSSEACIVTPIRILAPVFDLMNHGGALHTNAYFQLEEQGDNDELYLVVRALKDIKKDDELCIHYGNENTKPAWKCLVSYGFVPDYKLLEQNADDDVESEVAEVFLDGIRYEVGYSTIPIDMIHAMIISIELEMNHNGDGLLNEDESTPATINPNNILQEYSPIIVSEACLRIAKRMSDVAFDLLLVSDDDNADGINGDENVIKEKLISLSLAAKLRYSQHRVLVACAMNLRDYANQI